MSDRHHSCGPSFETPPSVAPQDEDWVLFEYARAKSALVFESSAVTTFAPLEGRAGRREIDRSLGGSVKVQKHRTSFSFTSGKPFSRHPAHGVLSACCVLAPGGLAW